MGVSDVIAKVRRPEYTGENRCRPCTVLNVVIAAFVALAMAVVSRGGGAFVFLASLGTIYLRGYLVPGTPTITETYFPDWLLDWFDKQPTSTERAIESTATAHIESAETLVAGNVLTPAPDGEGYSLTATFRDAWEERIRSDRARGLGPEDVRAMFDADDITQHGERSFVVDKQKSVRWDSEAAFVADVAAATELRERVGAWSTFDGTERTDLLDDLRVLLDRCPACDGALTTTEEYFEPCCRRKAQTVTESVCEECGTMVAERTTVGTPEDHTATTPVQA